jgi:hypothetical protein
MSVIVKTVSVAFFFAFLTLASNWGVLLQAGHDVALGVQGDSGAGSGGAGGGRRIRTLDTALEPYNATDPFAGRGANGS